METPQPPEKYLKPKKYRKKRLNGKNATGRPNKKIALKRIIDEARHMFTDRELAFRLGIKYATFKQLKAERDDIAEAIRIGHAQGSASLRAMQMHIAMKGNVPMLKHLGEQYLGQSEKKLHGNDPDNPLPTPITNVRVDISKLPIDQLQARLTQRIRESKG